MSNPKTNSGNDFIVAFIDILGASEAIKKDSIASFDMVNKAYRESLSIFDRLFNDKSIKPRVKIFSDNILVAFPFSNNKGKYIAFFAIAMMSAIIQVEFLKKGWLTRGGISSGDFFADDTMVWGNALLNAYALEDKVAIYPRVVIDPQLIGDLNVAMNKGNKKVREWLRQDKDGMFYIEFLNNNLKSLEIFVLHSFNEIEKMLVIYNDNPKICQKWLWLSSYIKERLPELGNGSELKNGTTDEK